MIDSTIIKIEAVLLLVSYLWIVYDFEAKYHKGTLFMLEVLQYVLVKTTHSLFFKQTLGGAMVDTLQMKNILNTLQWQ